MALFIIILAQVLSRRAYKILSRVEELIIGISGDKIFLREPLLIEYGVLKIVSRIVSGKFYEITSDYVRLSEPVLTDRIDLSFYRERGYLVLADHGARGLVVLPVAMILDKRYYGACITYIGSEMNDLVEGEYFLKVESRYGDLVYALVTVDKKMISGKIVFKKRVKARSARLSMLIPGGTVAPSYVKKAIIETTDDTFFTYRLYPDDQVIALFTYHRYFPVPEIFAEEFGGLPFIAGFHGVDVLLRLTIDLPLHGDVHRDYVIKRKYSP